MEQEIKKPKETVQRGRRSNENRNLHGRKWFLGFRKRVLNTDNWRNRMTVCHPREIRWSIGKIQRRWRDDIQKIAEKNWIQIQIWKKPTLAVNRWIQAEKKITELLHEFKFLFSDLEILPFKTSSKIYKSKASSNFENLPYAMTRYPNFGSPSSSSSTEFYTCSKYSLTPRRF